MKPVAAYRAVALAAALVVAALLVRQLLSLLLVVLVTIIVSLPLAAGADHAERRGLPRIAGVLAVLFAAGAIVTALSYLVVPQFLAQVREFANRVPTIVVTVERSVGLRVTKPPTLAREASNAIVSAVGHPDQLIGPIVQVGSSLLALLTLIVLVVMSAAYIATNPDPLLEGTLRLLPTNDRQRARDVLSRVRAAWLGWLASVAIDMLVLGALLFIGMEIIGLPFALGFALFSALMTVIPNYGSIISAIPPVLVGLSQSPSKGLLVLLVYVIVNQLEGNLILPLIMSRTVNLHPAVVTIGVVVMSSLFGVIGVLISIPLLSLTFILASALWIEPLEAGTTVERANIAGSIISGPP